MKINKKLSLALPLLFAFVLLTTTSSFVMAIPYAKSDSQGGPMTQGPRTMSQGANDQMGPGSQFGPMAQGIIQDTQGGTDKPISPKDVAITTNKLFDNEQGNNLGWNPDGVSNTFLILDANVDPTKSTIVADTSQSNFVICSVDFLDYGFFELHCNPGPAEGGELHYAIINGGQVISLPFATSSEIVGKPIQNITSDLANERAQNATGNISIAELPRALLMPDSNNTSTNLNSNVTQGNATGI